jgi:hypothetical protein
MLRVAWLEIICPFPRRNATSERDSRLAIFHARSRPLFQRYIGHFAREVELQAEAAA